jgi:hypothetical protein
MSLAGLIAVGETPTSDEANDALLVVNDVLENWSLETLMIWGFPTQTFNLVGGKTSYTIGPGGDFDTIRPIRIEDAYCKFNGVDFPVEVIDQTKYNLIALKTQQQPITEMLLYVAEFPLGKASLWPVPSQSTTLTLMMQRELTSIPSIATMLAFPPGYLMALRYAIAVSLAREYGRQLAKDIYIAANSAKADIKRMNRQPRTVKFDGVLTSDGPSIWQTGE